MTIFFVKFIPFEDLLYLRISCSWGFHLARFQHPSFPGFLQEEQPSRWGMVASMLCAPLALPWIKSFTFQKLIIIVNHEIVSSNANLIFVSVSSIQEALAAP